MADRDYRALGSTFAKTVLAKIGNAELRQSIETALAHADAAPALEALGSGAFMQSDYSRQLDELRAKEVTIEGERAALLGKEQTLNEWWENNHPKVLAFDRAVADGKLNADGTVKVPAPNGNGNDKNGRTYTEEELGTIIDKRLTAAEVDAAAYMETIAFLSTGHLQRFGEVINTTELRNFSITKKLPLVDAYRTMYKDKLDAYDAKIAKAAEDKIREDEREKMRKELSGQAMPLAGRGRGIEPSTLDTLEKTTSTGADRDAVVEATAEYEKLVGARG